MEVHMYVAIIPSYAYTIVNRAIYGLH